MTKTQKTFIGVAAAVAAVAGLALGAFWFFAGPGESQEDVASFEDCAAKGYPVLESYPEQCRTPDGRTFTRGIVIVHDPQPDSSVASPLAVRGEARGSWYFEASFPLRIEDADGNVLGGHFASAVLDPDDPESTWMTEDFVPFEAELSFDMSQTETGSLVLEKSNPSGLQEYAEEMRVPVRFEAGGAAQRTVKLFYYDPSKDTDESGNIMCSEAGLVALERSIPVTRTPIQDTVRLLLRGELTQREEAEGITSEYPLAGVELKEASLSNGVLTLGFNDPNGLTGGGSCRAGILWFQIRETAKQFDGVNEVRFRPEELFQP